MQHALEQSLGVRSLFRGAFFIEDNGAVVPVMD